MTFENEEAVFKFIKANRQPPLWVSESRRNSEILRALVLGENFSEVLINHIEKIESEDRKIARKKYSKDIRDLSERVNQPISSIFVASGGSVDIDMPEGKKRDKFVESLAHFKGQKSLKKYLSEEFFRLGDVDPNGLIYVEYKGDEDIYPTYKSIKDIRNYESNGQLLKFLIFEPIQKKDENGTHYIEWRVVDEKKEWRIKEINIDQFEIIEELTFDHPFGVVPAIVLGSHQSTGTEFRRSRIFYIQEILKDFARDKSIKTIYKFQMGFPRHGRYESFCRACAGTGKNGENTCSTCNGKGTSRKNDVTDVTILEAPKDTEDAIIAPNHEWFVSPDLATWDQFNKDLEALESVVEETQWGTKRVKEGDSETATGRFIDAQPIMNKLNVMADDVEWGSNRLARFVEDWVNGKPIEKSKYHESYGRRFIIESPDFILDKYVESQNKGANSTILDKLLTEWILSVHQTNPIMLEVMNKKIKVEPYIHSTLDQVSTIFGAKEASKKTIFVEFWEQADTKKDVNVLKTEFETYLIANAIEIVEQPQPQIVNNQ